MNGIPSNLQGLLNVLGVRGPAGNPPAAAPVEQSVAPAAPAPAGDQVKFSSGRGDLASQLGISRSSAHSPTSAVDRVISARNESELIRKLIQDEFPGLKLNPAQTARMVSYVSENLKNKGLNLEDIQAGLKNA
jgi:hypothetical protein